MTYLPRIKSLLNLTTDGLHARHVTRPLQDHHKKYDYAPRVPIPRVNAPQLLSQRLHKPLPQFSLLGFIALRWHQVDIPSLGLPDHVVYYTPTEVPTIMCTQSL